MVGEEVLPCSDGFRWVLMWNFGERRSELLNPAWALECRNEYGDVELCT